MGFDMPAPRLEATVSVLDPFANEAREFLRRQAAAITALGDRVNGVFGEAVHQLYRVSGHVIVTGLGKSGIIGKKVAATLASTGTPSFFVHAADALHGDLGMITRDDAVILISYSGETKEVVALLPFLKERRIATIALVGSPLSTLGRRADVTIDVSVDREICPHNLAPTNSTLAALAMSDALAISLMRLRGFRRDDLAQVHPAGNLGRKTARVGEVVVRDGVCVVHPESTVRDALLLMASSPHPIALVRDPQRLIGALSAHRIRESAREAGANAMEMQVEAIMDPAPPTIAASAFVDEAERQLERFGAGALVVLGEGGDVRGLYIGQAAQASQPANA